jgi:hypothetical protein
VFKYAGNDGAGDANTYLTDDTATSTTINLARSVETELGGQPVLPVMISYTCNLSQGNTKGMLANADQHAHSFANSDPVTEHGKQHDRQHASGTCRLRREPRLYRRMPARRHSAKLRDAGAPAAPDCARSLVGRRDDSVEHHRKPDRIRRGRQLAVPDGGTRRRLRLASRSEWIYEDADPLDVAQQTATYVDNLAVYGGTWKPHFLAIDRYEADDFTQRAYVNGIVTDRANGSAISTSARA